MTNRVVFCTISLLAAAPVFGQVQVIEPTPTPVKVVVTNTMPPVKAPDPQSTRSRIVVGSSQNPQSVIPTVPAAPIASGPSAVTSVQTATVPAATSIENLKFNSLGFRDLKNKIAEAKRFMQTRPLTTAAVSTPMFGETVRIAFNDPRTNRIDYVVVSKEAFLSVKEEMLATSEAGTPLIIQTIRENG